MNNLDYKALLEYDVDAIKLMFQTITDQLAKEDPKLAWEFFRPAKDLLFEMCQDIVYSKELRCKEADEILQSIGIEPHPRTGKWAEKMLDDSEEVPEDNTEYELKISGRGTLSKLREALHDVCYCLQMKSEEAPGEHEILEDQTLITEITPYVNRTTDN